MNEMWGDNDVIEGQGFGSGGKTSGTNMRDRKTSTITDNDVRGGGGGRGMREYTRVSSHVSRGTNVHEPVTVAHVGGRRGRLLEGGAAQLPQGVDQRNARSRSDAGVFLPTNFMSK